ncbi:MAG: dihydroorotase [Pseudomonadota bacterium]|jgi:dihydroorotase
MSQSSIESLEIAQPDDWHLHLREGQALRDVAPATAAWAARALVMPNLSPPVTTVDRALEYRREILSALGDGTGFNPQMTLYLTDNTPVEEVLKAAQTPNILAFKLYPAGATTNSDRGVTDLSRVDRVLEAMARTGLVLCVHGEVTQPEVDVFDREARFVEEVLSPLRRRHPGLRVVLEHITTAEGAAYVEQSDPGIAATITPQHLLLSRNAIFQGGLRPHAYCLPVLKRETHRQALLRAATSGNPRFFLGTDSAPHARSAKEASCGCAGCYTAPHALALYATAFEQANALERLEGFASHYGAAFYGLPQSRSRIRLVRRPVVVPDHYPFCGETIIPLMAGMSLNWTLERDPA